MSSGLSIMELASVGLPLGSRDGWLLMLHLYIDDSGTHATAPVVGVGGVMGNLDQWLDFDRAWRAVLAEPYPGAKPLAKWSTGDCFRGDGEFDGYGDAEKDLATRRFRDVIIKSGVFACSNMVDNVAWTEIMTARFGSRIDAESCSLMALIVRMRDWIPAAELDKRIAVFYDTGRRNEKTERFLAVLNDVERALPQIASFSFLKVKDATPLQAADMIATESYWYAIDYLKYGETIPRRAHFRHYLRENFENGNGAIKTRDSIEEDAASREPDGRLKDDAWAGVAKRLFRQQ